MNAAEKARTAAMTGTATLTGGCVEPAGGVA